MKTLSVVLLTSLIIPLTVSASIDKNLKYGQRDKEVSELQEFLIDGGFLNGNSSGFFGILTLKAVKAYQKSVGISPTGYVGVLTRQKINDSIASDIASSTQAEIQETGTVNVIQNTNKMTTPVIDYCKNIEGIQTKVPDGMFNNGDGICFTPQASINYYNYYSSLPSTGVSQTQSNNQARPETSASTSEWRELVFKPSGCVNDSSTWNCADDFGVTLWGNGDQIAVYQSNPRSGDVLTVTIDGQVKTFYSKEVSGKYPIFMEQVMIGLPYDKEYTYEVKVERPSKKIFSIKKGILVTKKQ